MLDILDVINEATKEANSFENHAAKNLTLEERLLYLQGLALVMNADGDIHPEEKEYLRILIKSFEMDESILESFVEFAQRPDKDTVQAFFRTFRRRPIAQLFLFDALMMTRRDDFVDEREKAVVDKIAEQLEVLKGTYQDIFDLFCHINNKDWDESALYFSSHLLNPEHFKHLLDYYEVDFDDLKTLTSEKNKSRLTEVIFRELSQANFDVEWGELGNSNSEYTQVTLLPIYSKVPLTKSILVSWLQSLYDRNLISVRHGLIYDSEDYELMSLIDEGLISDPFNKTISLSKDTEPCELSTNNKIIDLYYEQNEIEFDLNYLMNIFQAKNIAMCNFNQLPTLNGIQFSAITTGHEIGEKGHPNAIAEVKGDKLVVRWCSHCKFGHGLDTTICDDNDRRFTEFDIKPFIKDHGVYLVR
ncbi:TerB family tellurite resistance protein [Vibrio alginolyticus]|uniref:tellurite resistance TerB family protein n=1 Tax=Vibrio TaxID=662 RepID=UPI001CDC6337|nr:MULTISPECIES: TerB family tellurite resistance protein [Vibrio]MCA2452360.1 TerB family tellurite resistance protein [Vibrio alginolyticus]MCA2474097.1 TerB family tellurite resistance protein [Vibrio alginolyticus]MDW2154123.1 TerB family tellurite resistance protein [Vibrio sp. 2092]MDW2232363.1 TerB family tellurite resistance protein [Vibrio sp. 2091]